MTVFNEMSSLFRRCSDHCREYSFGVEGRIHIAKPVDALKLNSKMWKWWGRLLIRDCPNRPLSHGTLDLGFSVPL